MYVIEVGVSIGSIAFRKTSLGNRSIRTLKSAEACIIWMRLPVRKINSVCSSKAYCCTPVEIMLLPCMQIKYMPHLKRYGRSFRYDKSVSSYLIWEVSGDICSYM